MPGAPLPQIPKDPVGANLCGLALLPRGNERYVGILYPRGSGSPMPVNDTALARLWSFATNVVSVVLPGGSWRHGYGPLGADDLDAFRFIRPTLSHARPDLALRVYDAESVVFSKLRNRNLLLIGGPKTNRITRRVLEELQSVRQIPFSVVAADPDHPVIYGEDRPLAQLAEGGWLDKNYGVLIKSPRPYGEGKLIYSAFGGTSLGTGLCGMLLGYQPFIEQITDLVGSGSFFVVFATHLAEGSPLDSAIELLYPAALKGWTIKAPLGPVTVPLQLSPTTPGGGGMGSGGDYDNNKKSRVVRGDMEPPKGDEGPEDEKIPRIYVRVPAEAQPYTIEELRLSAPYLRELYLAYGQGGDLKSVAARHGQEPKNASSDFYRILRTLALYPPADALAALGIEFSRDLVPARR